MELFDDVVLLRDHVDPFQQVLPVRYHFFQFVLIVVADNTFRGTQFNDFELVSWDEDVCFAECFVVERVEVP